MPLKAIKMMVLLMILVVTASFMTHRNNLRPLLSTEVDFPEGIDRFISKDSVNKLLTQKIGLQENHPKRGLNLKEMEAYLNQNGLIKQAEVYLSVNGVLTASITPRKPVLRVMNEPQYFIDENGQRMDLSPFYTPNVPLVGGDIDQKAAVDLAKMASYIAQDQFLNQHITFIEKRADSYWFKVREQDYEIELGSIQNMPQKLNNYKAFYAKMLSTDQLKVYKQLRLLFDKQVVCVK